MPTILNLKFKGNKSFVPFSNLSDTDSLTKTWKVCTKVASFLEQGQRLENLSWRLWHLQNLIVDTDNAKSKREFKKLSKHMGDKLDKEKGRSIEELEAPGFRRNHSTELIQQRAIEKERNREASLNSRPGTITRMQFTFSVDQPTPAAMSGPVQKPDLKPSMEFNKRARRATVPSGGDIGFHDTNEKDPPFTQRGRRFSATNNPSRYSDNADNSPSSLRFPSLFSSDFDPHALLYPAPTRALTASYGEGVSMNTYNPADGFSIVRPTIELPLDELLTNVESPGPWSSTASDRDDFDQDIEMKPAPGLYHSDNIHDRHETPTTPSPFSNLAPLTPLMSTVEELPSVSSASTKSNKRPSLSVKTQTSTRSSNAPSATLTSLNQPAPHNSAPGGVKAECSNCGATHTPLWRRGLNDELNCNACGLYCKLHKRPRPKNMRNTQGEGRSQAVPRQEPNEIVVQSAQCYNCHTTATPLWRKDDEGKTVCNACGLYYKLHGAARPISMKSDVIRKRSRHDAGRRVGNGSGETPSASPGASRRASPTGESLLSQQPTLAPDSTTQISYNNETEYRPSSQSELMGALGQENSHHGPFSSQGCYSSSLGFNPFPGPYHPDYLSQNYSTPQDPLPFANDDSSDSSDYRINKRRRMSTDSASEPPSSATSYSSYAESLSTSQTSATSHSQRSSMDFPYNNYSSYGLLRGPSSTFWHPPMLPPDNSPHFIHPPMLPPDESPMDFLHPPTLPHEDDALFATYLHPPMILPDSPPVPMSALQLHPPMLPQDYKHEHSSYYDNHHSMQAY